MKRNILGLTLVLLVFSGCKDKGTTPDSPTISTEASMNDNTITEKYWKLIELNGQAVVTEENRKEIHIILKDRDSSVIGFGGCNSLSGFYELDQELGRLNFSKMASTLMACENMETEDMFHSVLSRVDNYTVKDDTLSLTKARMAPLARFQAVYLR